jgi:deoxyhypusine synthase
MEIGWILEIAALVLTAVVSMAGTLFSDKYKAMKNLINMLGEALEDDKLTKEEIQSIYRQTKKLL